MTIYSSKNNVSKIFSLLFAASLMCTATVDADNPKSGEPLDDKETELLASNTKADVQVSISLVKVRGFVVDEFGEPMVGVEVFAEGSHFKTITNTEGKYAVMAQEEDVLRFSQLGSKTKKEKITTSNILNISLLCIQ